MPLGPHQQAIYEIELDIKEPGPFAVNFALNLEEYGIRQVKVSLWGVGVAPAQAGPVAPPP